jgi:hypothetical protein
MSETCKKKFGLSTQRAIAQANKMVFHDGRLPGLMSFAGGIGDWDKMSFEEYYRARRRPLSATTLNDRLSAGIRKGVDLTGFSEIRHFG